MPKPRLMARRSKNILRRKWDCPPGSDNGILCPANKSMRFRRQSFSINIDEIDVPIELTVWLGLHQKIKVLALACGCELV